MLLSWERQSYLGMLLFWDDAFLRPSFNLRMLLSWAACDDLGMMLSRERFTSLHFTLFIDCPSRLLLAAMQRSIYLQMLLSLVPKAKLRPAQMSALLPV